MKTTVLLTGATGALGSMLLSRLIAEGYRVVCLVREKKDHSPRERVAPFVADNDVAIIRGDIREPRCGIGALDYEIWKQSVGIILHCAASIDFTDEQAASANNINGVQNVLDLADALGVWDFRHVSTAYVAGDAPRFSENDLYVTQRWRNAYESSKHVGETMVRAWATHRDERRYTVYRPSILIGCADGTTPTFDAYYGYFRAVHATVESVRRRLALGKAVDSASLCRGDVRIPLHFVGAPNATLNLVPIDWVADTMTKLLAHPARNETFHLVHPNPPPVRWVIRTSLDILRVRDAIMVRSQEEKNRIGRSQSPMIARLQRQIDKVHMAYVPYVTGEPVFVSDACKRVLKHNYTEPPEVDRAFLAKLLRYATACNWGMLQPPLIPAQ